MSRGRLSFSRLSFLPSAWTRGCRMTYSSGSLLGPQGSSFEVDPSLNARLDVPEGFECRRGIAFQDPRMITYYCEDPLARASGGQLETSCNFENSIPTAACILSVRLNSRAYVDCTHSPGDAPRLRSIADEITREADAFFAASTDANE